MSIGSLKSKIILAFGLTVCLLFFVFAIHYNSSNQLIEARKWVEHTYEVMERLESILSLSKDLETAQRGFTLTANDDFLEPYHQSRPKLNSALEKVRELTIDNPKQQERISRLETLESTNLGFIDKMITLSKANNQQSAIELMKTMKGKEHMDQIRTLVTDMENEERTLLKARIETADTLMHNSTMMSIGATLLCVLIAALSGFTIVRLFDSSFRKLQSGLDLVGQGDLNHRIPTTAEDEFNKIGQAFNLMVERLKTSREESERQSWLNRGLANMGQMLQGERDLQTTGQKILTELAATLGSRHGMFYIVDSSGKEKSLKLLASYAHHERKSLANSFVFGQGLIGQCALEKQKILVANAPDDYIRISSGTGESIPAQVVCVPVMFDNNVKAVIEQASFTPFTQIQLEYFDLVSNSIAVILDNIDAAQRTEEMLRKEQVLSEELQSQQEELRQQQEELQQSNEELEEKTQLQLKQNALLETKNQELEVLRLSMEDKAQQLTVTSKYKSEFLSNMSHELRTPLNSLLILSKTLYENNERNLTAKQVEFAKTIYSAGSDLLVLIDDVLDISKIEAGAMAIEISDESIQNLCSLLEASFNAMAREKGLVFRLELQNQLPRLIKTDGRRLMQVLRNLIANAIKFTEHGSITLQSSIAKSGWSKDNRILNDSDSVVVFSVIDTGIGIPKEKQAIIFEAFQQADGTTNRKYGGSGLGLAISREIARLLGGEISLESKPGIGSTFRVYLPANYVGPADGSVIQQVIDSSSEETESTTAAAKTAIAGIEITRDDRENIDSGDRLLLVVQDEPEFSDQLIALAHSKHFKVLRALNGKSAFALIQRFKPDAIVIDLNLPDKEGWILLDRLKRDAKTRHIPVHVFSDEDRSQQARRLGAVGYLSKPSSQNALTGMLNKLEDFVERKQRRLLIVEDNVHELKSIEELLDGADVQIASVSSGREALERLRKEKFDCMVLDLGLPDMTGFELLSCIEADPMHADLSVIVHTCQVLTAEQESGLRQKSDAIILKGAKSPERLLDETMLFLHRVEDNLPEKKRKMLDLIHLKDPLLTGRKVLIADDDIRHIFTSLLESFGMEVKYAETGKQAIDVLAQEKDVDLILMDVMMPEMDGFEAMREIRKMSDYRHRPIIALTAKAMKGDRDDCITAGASDYLSKPVDSDQLLSLMRVWLY